MSASVQLAALLRDLPSYWRTEQPILNILRAHRYGYIEGLGRSRFLAAFLAFTANMEAAEGSGRGSRARRRRIHREHALDLGCTEREYALMDRDLREQARLETLADERALEMAEAEEFYQLTHNSEAPI